MTPRLGCVILAHSDAPQLRRLVDRLDPLPCVVHCDRSTDAAVFADMRDSRSARVSFLPRTRTPWGGTGLMLAELAGLRRLLEDSSVTHLAVLSGSDYPLLDPPGIARALDRVGDRSLAPSRRLPIDLWGPGGGRERYERMHWVVRKHDVWLPVNRSLPTPLVPAGGSAQKVLARRHAAAMLTYLDARPDILRHWRHVWIPDETLIPSLLQSPTGIVESPAEVLFEHLWFMDWAGDGHRGPRVLGIDDLAPLKEVAAGRARRGELPPLFMRKCVTGISDALMDAVDRVGPPSAVAADAPA
jgi:hypothetical protein